MYFCCVFLFSIFLSACLSFLICNSTMPLNAWLSVVCPLSLYVSSPSSACVFSLPVSESLFLLFLLDPNNWIGPTVKHVWNDAMHVLHNFGEFDINTTAFCLGQYSHHLPLLKSSMPSYSVLMLLGTTYESQHFLPFISRLREKESLNSFRSSSRAF